MTYLDISPEPGSAVFVGGEPRIVSLDYEAVTTAGVLAGRAHKAAVTGDHITAAAELADAIYALQGFLTELTAGLRHGSLHVINYPSEDLYLQERE